MISPCINVCKVRKGLCIGCGRNLKQIKDWKNYTNHQRKQIIKSLKNSTCKELTN